MTRRALASLALFATMLGGCASPRGNYPSLAIRDVERAEGKFDVGQPATIDVPPVDVPATGDLATRLASLVNMAQAAHQKFTSAAPTAERTVNAASGAAVGSDSWAAAQVALADLDSARSQTAVALGDLDILFIAASVEATERDSITAARDRVIAIVTDEDATLERLRARVN